MEFFALKFQFWISKHRDVDQEIQNDTEHAAGEVLSGGDEEVEVVQRFFCPFLVQIIASNVTS